MVGSLGPPTESTRSLTTLGHLQIACQVAGFGLLTLISSFGAIGTLLQGFVWGRPAKGQPYQILATATDNPLEFSKTIVIFSAGTLFFGAFFAFTLMAYVYRIRLDRRRSSNMRDNGTA